MSVVMVRQILDGDAVKISREREVGLRAGGEAGAEVQRGFFLEIRHAEGFRDGSNVGLSGQ